MSSQIIYDKLKRKENWIAEFVIIKKSIPKHWLIIINTEQSKRSKVNVDIEKRLNIIDGKENHTLANKDIYKYLVKLKEKQLPLGFQKWKQQLFLDDSLNTKDTLDFIFFYLDENKFKMFRWKMLHFILPCNVNLKQWKIKSTDQCNFCKEVEDYNHFFIQCSYNVPFLKKMYKLLEELQIGRHVISLKKLCFWLQDI